MRVLFPLRAWLTLSAILALVLSYPTASAWANSPTDAPSSDAPEPGNPYDSFEGDQEVGDEDGEDEDGDPIDVDFIIDQVIAWVGVLYVR